MLGFFCTRPHGWEVEDVMGLLTVVIIAAAILLLHRFASRRYARTRSGRILVGTMTTVSLVPVAVAGAVVVWLAPC